MSAQEPIGYKNIHLLDGDQSIENGFIIIDGDHIQSFGPMSQAPENRTWQDGAGLWVTPGFINSHTHMAMSFMREVAHDNPDMIESVFFPFEKTLTAEDTYQFSFPSLTASLRSGATSLVEHYYHVEGIQKASEEIGARGFFAETLADIGGAQPQQYDLNQLMSPPTSLSTVVLGPHAMDTVSPDYMKQIASFAKTHHLPIHMHLSQTKKEYERCLKTHGKSPVQLAMDCGALGPQTLAVHLISASDDDIKILKDTGTYVGLCPTSQTLYEHIAPVRSFYEHQLPGALGTDCAASHDSMDIMQELRTLYLAYRQQGTPVSAQDVLRTVWENPATWLNKKLGAIKKDYLADLVFFKPDLSSQPCYHPHTHLLMTLNSRHVEHVLVNGNYVIKDKHFTTIDESNYMKGFQDYLGNKQSLSSQLKKVSTDV